MDRKMCDFPYFFRNRWLDSVPVTRRSLPARPLRPATHTMFIENVVASDVQETSSHGNLVNWSVMHSATKNQPEGRRACWSQLSEQCTNHIPNHVHNQSFEVVFLTIFNFSARIWKQRAGCSGTNRECFRLNLYVIFNTLALCRRN